MFRKEADLRRVCKATWKGNIFWIEPTRGSTMGIPDCFITAGGRTIWTELKIGTLVDGRVKVNVRPAQVQRLNELTESGQLVWMIVAIKNSDHAYYFLNGELRLWLQKLAFFGKNEVLLFNENLGLFPGGFLLFGGGKDGVPKRLRVGGSS